MNIVIVSSNQADAASLSQKLGQQGASVAVWVADGQAQSNALALLKIADLVITLFLSKPMQIAQPASAAYPFVGSKATVINDMLTFIPCIQGCDSLAEVYLQSKSSAPIFNAGVLPDFTVSYLYKKYGIASLGIAADTSSLIDTLVSQTQVNGIGSGVSFAGAGLGRTLWITDIKDITGKDIYPLFRAAASQEPLDVPRFELSLHPLKSLRLWGYYHSAAVGLPNSTEAAAALAAALSSDNPTTVYLTTVNKAYVYGAPDDAPAILPCTVSAKGITPAAAALPLQCVLASNDYIGALLTAVNALANKSVTLFKRAVKLDPYTASILALDEAETLADSVLMANPTALAFFGGK